MSVNKHVAHRRRLPAKIKRLKPDPSIFSSLGRALTARFVDTLYDRIEKDDQLRPKFSGNTTLERENQKKFFEEWLGGEPLYSFHVGFQSLRETHGHIHISKSEAKRWVGHFESALKELKVEQSTRREILATLRPLASALVNEEQDAQPLRFRSPFSLGGRFHLASQTPVFQALKLSPDFDLASTKRGYCALVGGTAEPG
ncbi:MAG: hypothetical protein N2C14_03590 [Planctomycetales bacterium]